MISKKKNALPTVSVEIDLFDGFINFFTGHAPKEIDRILQQTILFDFLKERFREHEKYLNIWRDIIEHWSDLLDENLRKILSGQNNTMRLFPIAGLK